MYPEDARSSPLLSSWFEEPSVYGTIVKRVVDHRLRSSQRKVCEMLIERLHSSSLHIVPASGVCLEEYPGLGGVPSAIRVLRVNSGRVDHRILFFFWQQEYQF